MRNAKVSKTGKLLISVMAVSLLIASLMVVSAFAAPAVGAGSTTAAAQGDVATVNVTGAVAGEQVTVLVYLTEPTDANIIYIDQTAADAQGAASFSFKIPAAAANGTYTVLVGSESSDIAGTGTLVIGDTDDVIGYSIFVYDGNFEGVKLDENGDVDTDTYVYFALTLDDGNGEYAVYVGENEIRYSSDRQKYVGLVPASLFSEGLPTELTVDEENAPTALLYGDAFADESLDSTDSLVIDYYLESEESMIDDVVAADIYFDSYIDSTDSLVIDYYLESEEILDSDDSEFEAGAVHYPAAE
jgi:hypothetical protein